MSCRRLSVIALVLFGLSGCAPTGNTPTEMQEFGIAPTSELRTSNHGGQTPTSIPGARRVTTSEVAEAVQANPGPILLDVGTGGGHATLPGAVWLPRGGLGTGYDDDVQRGLVSTAERLTGGDRSRVIITFCPNQNCWLSYNAALRLSRAGFTNVRWYRGGYLAWAEAGRPTVAATRTSW